MKLNTMRRVDRYVGVPLCAAVSLWCRIARLLSRRNRARQPKRFLFMELSEMGSAVLAFPAMRKLKEMIPDATLYFMIFEKNQGSVEMLEIIPPENVFTIQGDRHLLKFAVETLKTIWRCHRARIDVVFDLELFSRYSSLMSYLTGAWIRVGYYRYHSEGLYRGSHQTHKVSYNPHMHISRNFLAQVMALDAPTHEHPMVKAHIPEDEMRLPVLGVKDVDAARMLGRLRERYAALERGKLIILNTHAGDVLPMRAWPLPNYIRLTERLLTDPGVAVVLMGIGRASEHAHQVQAALGSERIIDMTSQTSFRELIDLFSVCDMLITNDSGPAHFASLTPIHVLTLFGPETPALYSPLGERSVTFFAGIACSPCLSAYNHRKTTCADNKCLQAITVDEVVETAARLLGLEVG